MELILIFTVKKQQESIQINKPKIAIYLYCLEVPRQYTHTHKKNPENRKKKDNDYLYKTEVQSNRIEYYKFKRHIGSLFGKTIRGKPL